MKKPELVFIGAKWCAQCPGIKKMVAQACDVHGVYMKVLDSDLDSAEALTYEPTAMPTIVYGPHKISGAITRQAIEAVLTDYR